MREQNDPTLIKSPSAPAIAIDNQWVVPEILAPAGGRQQFFAALNSGADAVFLGLQNFNARARATNFSADDLKELVPIAHTHGMKVLVTVNILIKQNELCQLFETLEAIESSGADAIIVQDLAVARIVKKYFPAIRLHASTQMAVHNVTGVLEAAKFGFRRVVLARELTHQEVRKIRQAVPRDTAELEVFCHGSLCYSYSGLCFFSGAEDARSGNRGECAYTCRQPYKIISEPGHGFLFSMRDLDTSNSLDLLIKAGVDTLKIEGRKKDAQYVASSVKLYRQSLNRLFGRDTIRSTAPQSAFDFIHDNKPVETDLEFAFKRQPTSLFLKSRYQENVIDLDNPTHKGLNIGTVLSAGNNQITFRTQHEIELYDGLRITEPGKVFHSKPQDGTDVQSEIAQSIDRYENRHIEFSIRGIFINGRSQVKAGSGDIVTVSLPDQVKMPEKGAHIYKVRSAELKARIEKLSQLPPDTRLVAHDQIALEIVVNGADVGLALSVTCSVGSFKFSAGDYLIAEAQRPRTVSSFAADLSAAFAVFGDSGLTCASFNLTGDTNWFIPRSVLKKFKTSVGETIRTNIDDLRSARTDRGQTDFTPDHSGGHSLAIKASEPDLYIVKTDRKDTAFQALTANFCSGKLNEIIFEPKRAFIGNDKVDQVISELFINCKNSGVILRLAVPTVVRGWDEPLLSRWFNYAYSIGVRHFEVGNVGGPELVRSWTGSNDLDLAGDFTLYALNSESHASIHELGVKSTAISIEDDLENIEAQTRFLSKNDIAATSVILYKDTPLFIAEACSLTALHNGCPTASVCGYRTLEIENKEGERYFVAHESCKSIVYGKNAFGITQLKSRFKKLGFNRFRIEFLTRPYNESEVTAVLQSAVAGSTTPATHTANFNRTLL